MSDFSELFSLLSLLYTHRFCQEMPDRRFLILYMSKYCFFFMHQILSHILLPLKKFFIMWISIIIIVINYTRTLNKFILYIQLCLPTTVQKREMSKNNFFMALESEVVECHFFKLSQNTDFWEKKEGNKWNFQKPANDQNKRPLTGALWYS